MQKEFSNKKKEEGRDRGRKKYKKQHINFRK